MKLLICCRSFIPCYVSTINKRIYWEYLLPTKIAVIYALKNFLHSQHQHYLLGFMTQFPNFLLLLFMLGNKSFTWLSYVMVFKYIFIILPFKLPLLIIKKTNLRSIFHLNVLRKNLLETKKKVVYFFKMLTFIMNTRNLQPNVI